MSYTPPRPISDKVLLTILVICIIVGIVSVMSLGDALGKLADKYEQEQAAKSGG